MEGYIKLYRKIFENPIVNKDPEYFIVWMFLLTRAAHKEVAAIFGGRKVTLNPGQLVTTYKEISKITHVEVSKIRRILKSLKNDTQIDTQKSTKNSLITVLNWDTYQKSDTQNDTQVTLKRHTSDTQTRAEKCKYNNNNIYLQECKNVRNNKARARTRENKFNNYPQREYKDYKKLEEELILGRERRG